MSTEERDVPDLPTLLTDITNTIERLDKSPADAMATIKNDILPLMKDFVESVIFAFEDVQDEINPIKLTGGEAQEIGTLLQAQLQANSGNPELVARIQESLDALGLDDDEEEDEEGEAEEPN